MLFRAVTSVAFMAAAANAAVAPKPYKLAKMSVPGLSLMVRDTNGYMPEEATCSEGATCEAACGAGFAQCPSNDAQTHCFNPAANQSCCSDGTGNSCEAGYYCTHDHQLQTWCCPDAMGLEECAAAYNVEGGLETPEPSTSAAETTSTSVAPTTSAAPTSSTPSPSSTPVTSTPHTTPHTTPCSTHTPTWTPSANSTISMPTVSWTNVNPPPAETENPTEPEPTEQPGSGASMAGTSLGLILAVAGVAALL